MVQPHRVTLTTQPASFQGNRDESSNVDMSLVQRDVQVSEMARPGTPPRLPKLGWGWRGPFSCFPREELWEEAEPVRK